VLIAATQRSLDKSLATAEGRSDSLPTGSQRAVSMTRQYRVLKAAQIAALYPVTKCLFSSLH